MKESCAKAVPFPFPEIFFFFLLIYLLLPISFPQHASLLWSVRTGFLVCFPPIWGFSSFNFLAFA